MVLGMRAFRYTPITSRALSVAVILVLSACGQSPAPEATDTDAGPDIDVIADACNPATQSGCEEGEKCASIREQSNPVLSRTACVPEGEQSAGESCTRGPDGPEGYDDCAAGLSCLDGTCAAICRTDPSDTCRDSDEAFGEGSYCTVFANLFSDTTGLCVPGCDPADDASCESGYGCYLNAERAVASCAAVPPAAGDLAQNADCYGPGSGDCFLNGCSPGHTPLLLNKTENADAALCARYCTPAESYAGNESEIEGVFGNCSSVSLAQSGGTSGNSSAHQCRFVQSFYDNTANMPAQLGMCVPVLPLSGGTWGDCALFDWSGIRSRWDAAVQEGSDPVVAFRNYCLESPADPTNSAVFDHCLGLFRGCVSLSEADEVLQLPTGAALMSKRSWLETLGFDRPSLDEQANRAWQYED
jgi:hypothetical protein